MFKSIGVLNELEKREIAEPDLTNMPKYTNNKVAAMAVNPVMAFLYFELDEKEGQKVKDKHNIEAKIHVIEGKEEVREISHIFNADDDNTKKYYVNNLLPDKAYRFMMSIDEIPNLEIYSNKIIMPKNFYSL